MAAAQNPPAGGGDPGAQGSNQNPSPPSQDQERQDQSRSRGRRGEPDIPEFVVEFANNNCANFTISCPPFQGVDIRGRWDTSRLAKRPQGMRDLGAEATKLPSPIPGARMLVDVRHSRAVLFDPLGTTDKETLKRYNAVAASVPALKEQQPFETLDYNLEEDQLKTLLHDLIRKHQSGCLDVISGELPTAEEVDRLSGHELYDPGNSGHDKPRYKKDVNAFYRRFRESAV